MTDRKHPILGESFSCGDAVRISDAEVADWLTDLAADPKKGEYAFRQSGDTMVLSFVDEDGTEEYFEMTVRRTYTRYPVKQATP